MDMKQILAEVAEGGPLSRETAERAFELIMKGEAEPSQTGALLGMIRIRGASESEIAGAAAVMRRHATRVSPPAGLRVIDTCGTGGDKSGTFNVSTAAAIVVAGAGRDLQLAVAKHGNRSVTSRSGSSEVLEALGVKPGVSASTLERCLEEAGMCFCFAPRHHPAMRFAAPVRAELGFRTLFNLLGPLTNPAGARLQVMGVFERRLAEPIARVLGRLGSDGAMVVNGVWGEGVIDEISTAGPTRVAMWDGHAASVQDLEPRDLGVPSCNPEDVRASDPASSAAIIRSVLAGEKGPARDLVTVNAAGALLISGLADDWAAGMDRAAASIDSGAAKRCLSKLAELTQADPEAA